MDLSTLLTGKSKDTLELSELSVPLVDVVMQPGQILYVPAGFPHTTGKYWSQVYVHRVQGPLNGLVSHFF